MGRTYHMNDTGYIRVKKITRCRWCGSSEHEGTAKDGSGFWCADCDGFTYFQQDRNDRHRMLLILEAGAGKETSTVRKPAGLRKRISPLRYPGGKSKLAEYMLSNTQPWQMDTFVEIFAGGGSLGLSLLDGGRIRQLILNDTDPDVYAFWKTVVDDPGYLIARTMDTVPTRELFFKAKENLGKDISQKERAWYFFLVNRTAFSVIQMANPMRDITCRWNPENLSGRIRRIASMKDRIKLCSMDACGFIEQYAYWTTDTTLFIDPPYYGKGKVLYPKAFDKEDHERLADMLNSLYTGFDGPDMIITYDQCPEIEALYPWADVQQINRIYSCKRQGE